MGVYLVTWKLNPERPDHDAALAAFMERLEAYQYITVEDFERVYFVSTELGAGQVNADLHRGLESDDMIIIAQVLEGTYCGWLPQVMWDWIEERLSRREGDFASAAPVGAGTVAVNPSSGPRPCGRRAFLPRSRR